MNPKLAIVTGNPLKFREISAALDGYFICEQKKLEGYNEIQGEPEDILRHKLLASYEQFQVPVLVDDTAVYLSALNGFPGPYIKDFWKCFDPYSMGMKFAGSRIKITCSMGIMYSPTEVTIVEGTVEGDIIEPKTKDDKGTEFDLFTQVDGTDRPMIECTVEEKNKFSHRGLAIKNLIAELENKNHG